MKPLLTRMSAALLAGLGCLGLAMAASAQSVHERPVAAKWTVESDDFGCTLTRSPATSDGLTLKIEADPTPVRFRIKLFDPGSKKDLVNSDRKAELVFSPGGRRFEGLAGPAKSVEEPRRGLRFAGDPEIIDAFGKSDGLAIWIKGKQVAAMGFGNAKGAIEALRRCNDDLLRSFGIDPQALAKLAKQPKPLGDGTIAQWVFNGDYPADALRAGASGKAMMRFTVGIDGRARDCAIVKSTGNKSLDHQSCALVLVRGRFDPAVGQDGQPTEAQMVSPFNWIIG